MEYTKYVTSNYSEKGINSVLDDIGVSAGKDLNIVEEVYNTALHALKAAGNEVTGIAIALALANMASSSSQSKRLCSYKIFILYFIILYYYYIVVFPSVFFLINCSFLLRLSFVSFIVASLV